MITANYYAGLFATSAPSVVPKTNQLEAELLVAGIPANCVWDSQVSLVAVSTQNDPAPVMGTITAVVAAHVPNPSNASPLVTFKPAAMTATITALPALTAAGGSLTATANGLLTVDGDTVFAGDVILVKNQAAAQQNGLYVVVRPGSAGTTFRLDRHPAMAGSGSIINSIVFVEQYSNTNPGSLWLATSPTDPVVLETTPITFVLVQAGQFPAPAGANPTASVGLAAVNGSAGTFMRSDAAPPIDQAIAPVWTGRHEFRRPSEAVRVAYDASHFTSLSCNVLGDLIVNSTQSGAVVQGSAASSLIVAALTGTSNASVVVSNTGGNFFVGRESSPGGGIIVGAGVAAYSAIIAAEGTYPLHVITNNTIAATIDSTQQVGLGINTAIGAQLHVVAALAGRKALALRMAASPSANPFEVQNSGGTPIQYTTKDGQVRVTLGLGAHVAPACSSIFDDTSPIAVGTTEADIFTHVLAANTLANNGDAVLWTIGGNSAVVATSYQWRVKFDGIGVYDSLAQTFSGAPPTWFLQVMVTRVDSTHALIMCCLTTDTRANVTYKMVGISLVTIANFTAGRILKVTGQTSGTGAGVDLVGYIAKMQYLPAAA